ncbi:MAG TPA: PP2C family protein-serine/threonine phosphatase [Verrucomicrobiae bacterium]|nr:PP2C family protein-serine/threonine phosphatase [Verrucomicrobiae bacterium]
MATNLWTDVEALDRLARSARAAEGRRGGPVFPGGRGGVEAPPILPRFHGDGFAVAASERPARLVSGDLVDAFPLSDREIAVVIGDVSGKGTPAGVMAAFVRSIVRHVAPLGASPGDTLERVNRILCGARLDAMYVTLFLGTLDLGNGLFRYASGGHPPAFRRVPGEAAIAFGSATGPVLGLLDRRRFDTGAIVLRPGEVVVMTTDGVTEAERLDGEFFGLGRLAGALDAVEPLSAEGALAAIEAGLEAFEGDARRDDATLLALQLAAA